MAGYGSSTTGTGSFATIHTDSYIGVGTSVTPKILTVAGDISSSGDLYVTGDFYESGSNPSKRLTLGGKSIFHGDISSSGDLYLSGDIYQSGSNPQKMISIVI